MKPQILCDLRGRFGSVRDQGERPTCLVVAASDSHASHRSPWIALSAEFLFFNAQRRAGRTHLEGASLAAVLDALWEDGQPAEAAWPYLVHGPRDAAVWRPPANIGDVFKCRGVKGKTGVEDVVGLLDRGQAAIVLLTLSPAFYRPMAGLVDDEPPGINRVGPRHAVIAVGHGRVNDGRAILVRNSWGAGWGEHGHAWLTEAYLAKRIFALAHITEILDVPANSGAA